MNWDVSIKSCKYIGQSKFTLNTILRWKRSRCKTNKLNFGSVSLPFLLNRYTFLASKLHQATRIDDFNKNPPPKITHELMSTHVSEICWNHLKSRSNSFNCLRQVEAILFPTTFVRREELRDDWSGISVEIRWHSWSWFHPLCCRIL